MVDGIERLHSPPEEFEEEEADGLPGEDFDAIERMIASLFPRTEPQYDEQAAAAILADYRHLDPQGLVPAALLRKAVLYFHTHKAKFPNPRYISVVDYRKRSNAARLFVVDMQSGAVWALHVAHGSGSDPDEDGFADRFGNELGSHRSSLGYMRTAETYPGGHGRSLKLDGLSSTNWRVRRRRVVVHSAAYVRPDKIQGMSQGCLAVPVAVKDRLIDMIRGGSLVYAGLS